MLITTIKSSTSLAQNDFVLNKGDKAPFAGVLVGEEHYRKYSEALDDRDFVNKQLANPDMTICPEDHSLAYLLTGLGAGILAGIILNR